MITPTPLQKFWTSPNGNRRSTTWIVVHHAAAEYKPGRAIEDIYAYHCQQWPDYRACGYHLIAQRDADGVIRIYQVNPLDMQGAHVYGRNEDSVGLCLATNIKGMPGDDWYQAAVQGVQFLRSRYPQAGIVGHKEITVPGWGSTCPGPRWAEWKLRLQADVAAPAAPPAPAGDGLPTPLPYLGVAKEAQIRGDTFAAVLRDHQSPLAPFAMPIYDWLVSLDIDAAIWLAQCAKESRFCTTGLSKELCNPLNIRQRGDYPGRNGFADFRGAPWLGALWSAAHLKLMYGQRGLTTLEQIVPIFAPVGDGDNNPAQYIAFVRRTVADIRRREVA